MTKFGIKVSGCFGDVLYSTPTVRHISKCHNQKIMVETNRPELFINNPFVEKVYNPELGETLPKEVVSYDANGHNFGEFQKQIRTIHLVDYWSTHLGFTLLNENKNLDFFPDPLDIELPSGDYIVINPSKTWDCRTWSKENWESLVNLINKHQIKVVVVGKDIVYNGDDEKTFLKLENQNVINLVNKLNLSQLWHVLNNSLAVITMAAGVLPFAGTTDAFIIHLGSATHPEYRTPYRHGTQSYKHKFVGGSCKLHCQSDMKYNVDGDLKITRWNGFRSPGCYENKSTYECHPSVNAVYNSILEILKYKDERFKNYKI